jgi:hypothetical protein
MRDEKYTPQIGSWLKGREVPPPDSRETARQVAARLPQVRQRDRWWPLPDIRRVTKPSSADKASTQVPSSIPATNGHTPTVIGRTQSMFNPAKAVIAGALVFGIGGVMLIAQPYDRQGGGVPGATTDDPAMAPSFFSGTTVGWNLTVEPVTVRRDDGVVEGSGESYTLSWDANDPRIAGSATIVMNETDYREGATMLVPTGDVGSIRTLLLGIDNDEGSWQGPLTVLQQEGPPEVGQISGWLTGSGAYEGLSAYLAWDLAAEEDLTFWGHITAEGAPPAPESLPE